MVRNVAPQESIRGQQGGLHTAGTQPGHMCEQQQERTDGSGGAGNRMASSHTQEPHGAHKGRAEKHCFTTAAHLQSNSVQALENGASGRGPASLGGSIGPVGDQLSHQLEVAKDALGSPTTKHTHMHTHTSPPPRKHPKGQCSNTRTMGRRDAQQWGSAQTMEDSAHLQRRLVVVHQRHEQQPVEQVVQHVAVLVLVEPNDQAAPEGHGHATQGSRVKLRKLGHQLHQANINIATLQALAGAQQEEGEEEEEEEDGPPTCTAPIRKSPNGTLRVLSG